MKHFTQGLFASLLFSALGIFSTGAQNVSKTLQLDSTVVRASDGSTTVKYFSRPLDYGFKAGAPMSEVVYFSSEKKAPVAKQTVSRAPMKAAAANLSSYSVGAIPLQEGTSPVGAKTYQVPIAVAGGLKFTPSISLCYNSQAGDGVVGYGWSIAGYSSITLVNKNVYYHGKNEGAVASNTDAVFSLDGVPLVQNTQSGTKDAYPLITATGNILVCPNKSSSGYVYSFNVRYPDGSTAVFGNGASSASRNKARYPIDQMTDRDGNKITYQYSFDGGRLDAVRYDYDSAGQYKGEITLGYRAKYDQHSFYFAGEQMAVNYEVLGITSKYNGEVICRYGLDYLAGDGAMKLVKKITCFNGDGQELPPLVFEYGVSDYPQSTTWVDKRIGRMLNWNLTQSQLENMTFKRGRFVLGGGSDGIIAYPKGETYGVTDKKRANFLSAWQYEFGSNYPEDQEIIYLSHLEQSGVMNGGNIIAGPGFQTMEAVDIDGDGQDELVKVNFNGTYGTVTRLLFTVSEINAVGYITQTSQFTVDVQGVLQNSYFTSPYKREYYWGDFVGNGKTQLLTIAYDKNYNSEKVLDQVSYTTLIDLSTHVKLFEQKLFDMTSTNYKRVLAIDLDNDSQTELCYGTSSGLDVYRFRGSSFVKEKTLAGDFSFLDRQHYIADVNADGYIDFMVPPSTGVTNNKWTRYAFDGERFTSSNVNICRNLVGNEFMFCDVNHDGCSDLLVTKENSSTLEYYKNYCDGLTWTSVFQLPNAINNSKGIIPTNIANPIGQTAFMMVDGSWAYEFYCEGPSPVRNQLIKSTDSYGRTTVNTYVYLPTKIDYAKSASWWDSSLSVNNADGYAFMTPGLYVLASEESYLSENTSAANKYKSRSYEYFNSVVHNLGLGFCGFSKVRTIDHLKNLYVEESHNPQKRGVVTSVKTRVGSFTATPFSTVTNTYDNNSTTYGKLNPRLTKSVGNNTLTGVTTTTSYTYGAYDLPTKVVTSRQIGTGAIQKETLTRTYKNTATATKYILGLVTEEGVVRESDGDETQSWKERTVNTYNSDLRLTNSKHYVGVIDNLSLGTKLSGGNGDVSISLGGSSVREANNLVSETRWTYDSFGNVATKKVASYGATNFLGYTYTYDSDGRYLLTEKDAFEHTTTYSGYNKFGMPTTVKDYRNRTTTYVYDAWGTVTKKTYPDGTVEQSVPAWGGAGLYKVTSTVTGKPQTIAHYDALGREVRSDEKRFNGQWQYVSMVYDNKGRLQKVSLPYRGASATYWNNYAYDAYDRPTSLAEASGKVTVWSYNGASTTTVKDGIQSVSTMDASGNIIRVVDAGGTITYALRDDGQPASITAPGNVTTTFTYDNYGRRTKIVDPSAGTETDSYVWNSNGSSVQTHVNPNGTVKIYVDTYGRTTKVERPGEYTTTYTYNSYNLLTKEQSTNGTSTEYTYDSNSRVATSKETVPDGKWLKKTYTYTSGSVLSKIAYESQSGVITTETYTYANGHNTKIALPNGTVVWNLVAENDLGQPTTVISGGVTREYDYTDFGMPRSRRMANGTLQDMSYQFDPATGNLLSRCDETRDKTEAFTYDNLNRLKTINARQITYDAKGNILRIGGVGTMTYGSSARPYQITGLTTTSNNVVANRAQSVSYTCYSRPSVLTEGSRSAAFTYNGDGDRVKMYVANGSTQVLTRYYIGGRYEFDQTPSGTKERLYLGGDAYSAPMVYQREGSGSWTAYNIGRDYLGNITHIATASGTLVAEYSYDPWGRLRNPSTLSIYTPGNEPELFLGRGFTGHEHLTWFGLINMNARLYDPVVGRFLSPDPYVQSPDFTQNYNRYSYALNNPLRYVDEDGEFLTWSISASGFSIGINFSLLGIPIGFGINIGWGEGGYIGVYGEVGYRVGGTGFGIGAAVNQSLNYGFRDRAVSTTTNASIYASFGMFTASVEATYSYSLSYECSEFTWKAAIGISAEKNSAGLGLSLGYGSAGFKGSFETNGTKFSAEHGSKGWKFGVESKFSEDENAKYSLEYGPDGVSFGRESNGIKCSVGHGPNGLTFGLEGKTKANGNTSGSQYAKKQSAPKIKYSYKNPSLRPTKYGKGGSCDMSRASEIAAKHNPSAVPIVVDGVLSSAVADGTVREPSFGNAYGSGDFSRYQPYLVIGAVRR